MWQNAHNTYIEERVLSAGPLELVGMLYQSAIGSVRDARRHLAGGDILARSRSISKACEVIGEQAGSLDLGRGGELAVRLAQLYEYMLQRLSEANFRQADEPLSEVLGLLLILVEGWDGIRAEQKAAETAPH